MNPVTGAVPPLIRGHGIRFEVDRWTWRRLDAARFDGERRHLLATRGRPWHADPEHGGDTGFGPALIVPSRPPGSVRAVAAVPRVR